MIASADQGIEGGAVSSGMGGDGVPERLRGQFIGMRKVAPSCCNDFHASCPASNLPIKSVNWGDMVFQPFFNLERIREFVKQ